MWCSSQWLTILTWSPKSWSVLSPTCIATVLFHQKYRRVNFSSYFQQRCRYESFNLEGFLWTIQIYLDHSNFFPSNSSIISLTPLFKASDPFLWNAVAGRSTLCLAKKGARWYQVGPSSWSWKQFRVAVWHILMAVLLMAFWRDGCLLEWIVSPILEAFALPSKQELFDHCFVLLVMGLDGVGVVLDGEPLCLVSIMLIWADRDAISNIWTTSKVLVTRKGNCH